MKLFLTLLLSFLFTNCYTQDYDKKSLAQIKALCESIHSAAQSHYGKKLEKLLYPMEVEGNDILTNRRIDRILANNIRSTGDFSYSNSAMKLLIDTLYTKFKPVPKELLPKLTRQPELSFMKEANKNNIAIFDFKGAHIILFRSKKKFQLVFWENMNNILKD